MIVLSYSYLNGYGSVEDLLVVIVVVVAHLAPLRSWGLLEFGDRSIKGQKGRVNYGVCTLPCRQRPHCGRRW